MNLLRQTPFPLEISYTGLTPSHNFLMQIFDDKALLLFSFDVVSNEEGHIEQELPKYFEKFDGLYVVQVFSLNEEEVGDLVLVDNLEIKRPYINPYDPETDDEENEKNIYNERLSRSIIDAITGGFYYRSRTIELTGLGGDFLSIPDRINRINFIYRNNIKVYDRFAEEGVVQDVYVITPDYSAITIKKEGVYNRLQSSPVMLPLGASDSFNLYSDYSDPIAALTKIREFDMFPKDYDYVITGEFGWPVVPQDIQDATRMLINDVSCNKLQYIGQYIKEYKTDQFTIKYDDLANMGTGNFLVDKILEKYHNNFYKIGVL